ncbi:CC42M protein, partial [Anhinga anhinga]|nr:CC42M protein [Anhinga anhinga]
VSLPVLSPLGYHELHATGCRTVPAWDATALLPSTRLLLKRREVAEVEQALQSQREEFRHRMERLEQRRQQLGQREDQLRDVILKFNAFLKPPWLRRPPAGRAGQDGAGEHRGPRPAAPLARGQAHPGQQPPAASQPPPAAQFQDVPAMLAHFGALAGARAALAQQAEARQERLAQGQAQLRQYQEEASSELLHTTTELTQLRAQLEATRHAMLQGESCWAHVQSTATHKTLLLGQIKLAVLNLFQLATARLKVLADVALEDTEAQLDTVLLCMQDLAAICAELRPRQQGLCPPRLPVATSMHPLRQGGARVPPSQE